MFPKNIFYTNIVYTWLTPYQANISAKFSEKTKLSQTASLQKTQKHHAFFLTIET